MKLSDWRNTHLRLAVVYVLAICSFQLSPSVSNAQNLGQSPQTGQAYKVKPQPTRRNGSQPRELGRQCDLSCRSGAGGGHGSRLLFPRTRCRAMGGTAAGLLVIAFEGSTTDS